MQSNYKINHVIVCDDLRREANQKEIIIGLYPTAEIIFQSLPAIIPMLTFRIQLHILHEPLHGHIKFQVRGPDGKTRFTMEGEIEAPAPAPTAAVVFQKIPCDFDIEGNFDLLFGINNERLRKIGSFKVTDRSKVEPT